MTREPQKKPGPSQPLLFGKTFTDHMLMVEWTKKTGWSRPRIQPFQNLTLHPACSALHYSLQVGPAAPVGHPLLCACRTAPLWRLHASSFVGLSSFPEITCALGPKLGDSRFLGRADLGFVGTLFSERKWGSPGKEEGGQLMQTEGLGWQTLCSLNVAKEA